MGAGTGRRWLAKSKLIEGKFKSSLGDISTVIKLKQQEKKLAA